MAAKATDSKVKMIKYVTPALTDNESHLDIGVLLRFMDICTCASAEKHTKVNCVTVAMSDVIMDYRPRLGDTVELEAFPVLVGNTSLEIQLNVTAFVVGDVRQNTVCSAIFTYVTTRGEKGEKQICPTLDPDDDEMKLANETAVFRKSLMKVKTERHASVDAIDATITSFQNKTHASTRLTMTEVILPPHQNHMKHTFGGVVMNWMHDAAHSCVSRFAGTAAVSANSISSVSFLQGSDVSDHVVFRAMINGVFENGTLAEVGLQVVKHNIKTNTDEKINNGYFMFKLEGSGRKFPKLEKPPLGTEEEDWFRKSQIRYQQLVSRRQLLTNVGGAFKWSREFKNDAPVLTLASVQRLFFSIPQKDWQSVDIGGKDSSKMKVETALSAWGRSSFITRVTVNVDAHGLGLHDLLPILKDERAKWDGRFKCIDSVVQEDDFDIAHFKFTFGQPTACLTCFCGCNWRTSFDLCLLRAWRSSSDSLTFASRSVKHEKVRSTNEVLPSGWLIRIGDSDSSTFDITYALEAGRDETKKLFPIATDACLKSNLAKECAHEVQRLASYMKTRSRENTSLRNSS